MLGPTADEPDTSSAALLTAIRAAEFAAGRRLIEAYAAHLGVDLCFQGFDAELVDLPGMYGPPSGCLILGRRNGEFVGCGGLRRASAELCEMKRLYVDPGMRGTGLGRRIAVTLIERARTLGYGRMVLDTLPHMVSARGLYESLGFRPTDPYYRNPLPGVLYLSLDLAGC